MDFDSFYDVCGRIGLQKEIHVAVARFVRNFDFCKIDGILQDLLDGQTAPSAYMRLENYLGVDKDCMKMLACQLVCASLALEKYRAKKIPNKIFYDTMKCFSRFVEECHKKTGLFAFDRGWWTYRQLSMVLFRLGELEYELLSVDGKKKVSLHIPSDANITPDCIDGSLACARKFLADFYPDYMDSPFVCESWLMSPRLKELLEEDSNILAFQKRFDITSYDAQDIDFIEWIFKTNPNKDCDYSALPETTSLQKKTKKMLLEGSFLGCGVGLLRS